MQQAVIIPLRLVVDSIRLEVTTHFLPDFMPLPQMTGLLFFLVNLSLYRSEAKATAPSTSVRSAVCTSCPPDFG
jgi:hypothetical protein